MTWQRRIRPVLYIGGGLLLISSLLGARLLVGGSALGNDPSKGTTGTTAARSGSGPVVIGYVDTDPRPVSHGLPPVMQSGLVVKVLVREGDAVKEKDPLFAFDSSIQEADLKIAEQAAEVTSKDLKIAEALKNQHEKKVNLQDKVVAMSQKKVELALNAWKLGVSNMKEAYSAAKYPPETWEDRLSKEVKIFELYSAHAAAELEYNIEVAKFEDLKAADPGPQVAKAKAGVGQAEAVVTKARAALDLCTVRAKVNGTVEQINISPGDVLGIGTRTTAVWVIPDGPRVVRAEVEADFAHRVTSDRIGKDVTIHDHTDGKLTYKGTIKRIGGSFLPKRMAGESLIGNDTRVLEAVILVTDPAPRDQPPLRVGQKVRVNFGE